MTSRNIVVNKMGNIVPTVARGINPHAKYRASALTMDAPSGDSAFYASDLGILDGITGKPTLMHIPAGASLAATGNALKAFVVARGGSFVETGAAAIDPALTFLRDRLYLIKEGSEYSEMPLINTGGTSDLGFDVSYDNALKIRDGYYTDIILSGVAAASYESITKGGSLCIFVNDTTGVVTTGASGACPVGSTAYEIEGTLVLNPRTVIDNAGLTKVLIDIIC